MEGGVELGYPHGHGREDLSSAGGTGQWGGQGWITGWMWELSWGLGSEVIIQP